MHVGVQQCIGYLCLIEYKQYKMLLSIFKWQNSNSPQPPGTCNNLAFKLSFYHQLFFDKIEIKPNKIVHCTFTTYEKGGKIKFQFY